MASSVPRRGVAAAGPVRLLTLVAVLSVASVASVDIRAQATEPTPDGGSRRFYQDDPLWTDPDMMDIGPPEESGISKTYDFVVNTFSDPSRSDGPALNVNTLGEVPDSAWFTNRLGRHDMSLAELVRGPNTVDGPAPGVWEVIGRSEAGITPKFNIRDSRGDVYVIKLDPADIPELPSSVEMIATKIFHAIGYHVPEDYLVSFALDRLTPATGATTRAPNGDRVPIRQTDLERWLRDQPRSSEGTIRALASKFIPGEVLGEFRYWGTRSDDPNDIYPHERRRELRGLRVFAAWLNHDDARSPNTLESYVEDGDRHYVRHYLQDFGSTMGSGSTSAQQPRGGNEYLIEGRSILEGLATLGFWERDWLKVRYPDHPGIGNFEADFFEPERWKPEYPHPAFDRMDAVDAFWAASIASRFTDDIIRALVEVGELGDATAARYLTDTIIRRRDKVVRYWIGRTNPLDRFAVNGAPAAGLELTFDNAAVRLGAAPAGGSYIVQWSALDNMANQEVPAGAVTIETARAGVPVSAWGPRDDVGDRYAVADIETIRPDALHWRAPVRVTLRDRGGEVSVVGIERPTAP